MLRREFCILPILAILPLSTEHKHRIFWATEQFDKKAYDRANESIDWFISNKKSGMNFNHIDIDKDNHPHIYFHSIFYKDKFAGFNCVDSIDINEYPNYTQFIRYFKNIAEVRLPNVIINDKVNV
jgi:hypothetical protein